MQRPPNLLISPGIYVVAHAGQKVAYIGLCSNIAHRANMWKGFFKAKKLNSEYKIPIAKFPDYPGNQWTFMPFYTDDIERIRTTFEKAGFTFINKLSKRRKLFTYGGKEACLALHAKDAGLNYATVYKRIKAGKTLEEALTIKEDD